MGKSIKSPANPWGTPPEDRQQELTSKENTFAYIDYYQRMRLICLSAFKWEGLPFSCNARFLEQTLFETGLACFCNHKLNGQLINLQATPSAKLNIYYEADNYTCFSNSYTQNVKREDLALCRNNYDSIPTAQTVRLYARRMADVQRIIDINLNAQKTPILISCDDSERLTLKNLYMQYDGNVPVIYGDKGLKSDCLKVLKTDCPYLVDKLVAYKKEIWGEFLKFVGIDSVSDKKERRVINEVDAENAETTITGKTMLDARQECCAEVKEKFGINLYVRYNIDIKEGEEDVEIYDGVEDTIDE